MFDLTRFSLADTFEVSATVAELTRDAERPEAAAERLVRYFYENAVDKTTGERSLALVQCFVTRPFDQLPEDLKDVAVTAAAGNAPHPRQPCLTLLAAAGDSHAGPGNRVLREGATVPVPSRAADEAAPVAAGLVARLHDGGMPGGVLYRAEPSFAVGYVPDARGGVLAGWQGVVVAYGIHSALAFTGRLGETLGVTVVLHSSATIPESTAHAFSAVGIGLKLAMLPYFGAAAADSGAGLVEAQGETLRELLRVRHEIALEQSSDLEQALELSERRAAELAVSQDALARSEARASAVVGSALDAVVMMDASGRVVEWNPAAEVVFDYSRDEALGELVADLIVPDDLRSRHIRGIENYLRTGEGPFLRHRVEITAMRSDGSLLPVELSITPVPAADGRPLFTAFIRDITERRAQEAALLTSRESFAHIARTLQRSLLPAALPSAAGFDLGAVFHPSRAGSDVGGDFYDVFPVDRGDLVMTLGDVCGKGAEAAAITAIARHTVRAVAPELRHPATILRRLNDTLVDHDIGERFCSMVAARAVPIVRGVRLSVCCAGHPQPMVIREGGSVERVGVPGSLLGLFRDVRLLEETVQLSRGDTIVFFTDGVTEASRDGEYFGETRLAAALVDARESTASAMAARVLDAVLEFGGSESRDDIAVLVVRAADLSRPSADR